MLVFQALTPEASNSFPNCGKPQCLLSNPGTLLVWLHPITVRILSVGRSMQKPNSHFVCQLNFVK